MPPRPQKPFDGIRAPTSRRYIATLLATMLVGGLAACGSSGGPKTATTSTSSLNESAGRPPRTNAPSGTQTSGGQTSNVEDTRTLTYIPVSRDPVVEAAASVKILQRRLAKAGAVGSTVTADGSQLKISLPQSESSGNGPRMMDRGDLAFFDWETSVIGKNGEPAPDDFSVTGGPQAGQTGCLPQFDALARARRQQDRAVQAGSSSGRWYLVDNRARKVVASQSDAVPLSRLRQDDAVVTAQRRAGRSLRAVHVNRGTLLVQAESTTDGIRGIGPDCYYVLNDSPVLRGADLTDFGTDVDATGHPDVRFTFTDDGRAKWQQMTRAIARRGSVLTTNTDGVPLTDPQQRFQHFAVVLDDRLLSVPYIDFQQTPNGLEGAKGSEIVGAFTRRDEAKQLAALLSAGPLPSPLELVADSNP